MPTATIPDSMADLFQRKTYASLATVMPDGTPHVTTVWVDRYGDMVLVNSSKGKVKDRNVRANPKVGLAIPDPEQPFRYLSVQGEVVEIREEGADAHIDKLAKRYLEVDTYPYRNPEEVRVIYVIRPLRVHVMSA